MARIYTHERATEWFLSLYDPAYNEPRRNITEESERQRRRPWNISAAVKSIHPTRNSLANAYLKILRRFIAKHSVSSSGVTHEFNITRRRSRMEFINNVMSGLRGSILMTAHIRHLAFRYVRMPRFICYQTMGENSGARGWPGKRNREKVGEWESATGRVIRPFN